MTLHLDPKVLLALIGLLVTLIKVSSRGGNRG